MLCAFTSAVPTFNVLCYSGRGYFLFLCPVQGVLMGYDEQAMTSWMVGCMRLHSWRLHEERITKSCITKV